MIFNDFGKTEEASEPLAQNKTWYENNFQPLSNLPLRFIRKYGIWVKDLTQTRALCQVFPLAPSLG